MNHCNQSINNHSYTVHGDVVCVMLAAFGLEKRIIIIIIRHDRTNYILLFSLCKADILARTIPALNGAIDCTRQLGICLHAMG